MKRVATFLLAAGLVSASAAPVLAAPPSSDPTTGARYAAAWIAKQVNASGFIPQAGTANPNLSVTAQAVTALAAAGVGRTQVGALLGYLGTHIDNFVVVGGHDDPGALAYLILAADAGGADPTSFGAGHANLVTRLVASQQPSGLFGVNDATFDGAFREGLALLALHAAGVANAAGVAWLEGQQCAGGAFVSFRADPAVACPAVDPSTFTGPDTNSTALAVLGLQSQGATAAAAAGVTALDAARNAGGGWGFLSRADQSTDANSTGVALEALRTVTGSADTQGIAALLALQVGCTGDAADRGGIAFQPGAGGVLAPDAYATVQATPALAEVALPITDATIATELPTPCAPAPTTTTVVSTSTTVATTGSTVASAGSTAVTTATTVASAAAAELPRTGTSSAPIAIVATIVIAAGLALVGGSRRRRT